MRTHRSYLALGCACGLFLTAGYSRSVTAGQIEELSTSAVAVAGELPTIAPANASRCTSVVDTVRVRLTIGADALRGEMQIVRDIVEDAWAREGVGIAWATTDAGWDGVDLWVALLSGMTLESGVMGEVRFHGNTPRHLARISIDAVMAWVREHEAARLGVQLWNGSSSRVGDTAALMTRALGYAAAHEIGHFVLATRAHGSSGLMAPAFPRPEQMPNALAWRLDPQSRKRLQQTRLQSGCHAASRLAIR